MSEKDIVETQSRTAIIIALISSFTSIAVAVLTVYLNRQVSDATEEVAQSTSQDYEILREEISQLSDRLDVLANRPQNPSGEPNRGASLSNFENDFMTMDIINMAADGKSLILAFEIRSKLDQQLYIANNYRRGSLIIDQSGKPLCGDSGDTDYELTGLKTVDSTTSRNRPESYSLVDSSNPILNVSWTGNKSGCREISGGVVLDLFFELVRLETTGTGDVKVSLVPVSFSNVEFP